MKLIVIIAFFTATLLPSALLGQNAMRGDGKIAIYSYHLDEYVEAQYRDESGYIQEGLAKITNVMRSRDGKSHEIDPSLIELMDEIQDHFGAETVEVISGYRSSSVNKSLITNGRGAAGESLHMKGIACDIHIDEASESDIYRYVKNRARGGAGFYPRYGFVHVDVGPVRSWEEPPWPNRVLVGSENNPNQNWAAITDKDIYSPGEDVTIKISNNSYSKNNLSIKSLWIEGFRKGSWSEHKIIGHEIPRKRLSPGEDVIGSIAIHGSERPGKYRLVAFTKGAKGEPPFYSNEFYIRNNEK